MADVEQTKEFIYQLARRGTYVAHWIPELEQQATKDKEPFDKTQFITQLRDVFESEGLPEVISTAKSSSEDGNRSCTITFIENAREISEAFDIPLDESELESIEGICRSNMPYSVKKHHEVAYEAARNRDIYKIADNLPWARLDASYGRLPLPTSEEKEIWDMYFEGIGVTERIAKCLHEAKYNAIFTGNAIRVDVYLTAANSYRQEINQELKDSDIKDIWFHFMICGNPQERFDTLKESSECLFLYKGPTDVSDLNENELKRLRDGALNVAQHPENFGRYGILTGEERLKYLNAAKFYAEKLVEPIPNEVIQMIEQGIVLPSEN